MFPALPLAMCSWGIESMNDPIVEEVRGVRDAHAARLNYDLDAIFQDIKAQEEQSGHTFIAGIARKTVAEVARLWIAC